MSMGDLASSAPEPPPPLTDSTDLAPELPSRAPHQPRLAGDVGVDVSMDALMSEAASLAPPPAPPSSFSRNIMSLFRGDGKSKQKSEAAPIEKPRGPRVPGINANIITRYRLCVDRNYGARQCITACAHAIIPLAEVTCVASACVEAV